jgi:NDP-sugar pyrophosphorylase family protein
MAIPRVAILAGGLGTRLGELTRDVPKAMMEVAGRPFLTYVIESFASRGLRELVLLVGHQAEAIEEHFGDGSALGVAIEYSRENEPLGTGGAVREARSLLGERFVITYGDVLRRFDYDRFVNVHDRSALAVYPYRPGLTTIGCGNVALNADGRAVALFRKGQPELRLPYVDAGFALLQTSTLDLLPVSGACSLEGELYARLASAGQLEAEVVDMNFFDIGNPSDLAVTRAALERERA